MGLLFLDSWLVNLSSKFADVPRGTLEFDMSGHEKHTRIAVLTIFLAMVVTILAGCKSPEPNPELRDPIYSDLSAQAGAYKGKVESQQKKLEDLTAELEKMTTRDPNRKRAIKDKYDLERGLAGHGRSGRAGCLFGGYRQPQCAGPASGWSH